MQSISTPHSLKPLSSVPTVTRGNKPNENATPLKTKVGSVFQTSTTELKNDLNQSCIGKMYQRFVPLIPLISDGCRVVSSTFNTGVFDSIVYPAPTPSSTPSNPIVANNVMNQMIAVGKVLTIVSVPLAIYNILTEISNAIRNIEVVESLLRIGEQCAWVSEGMASFLHGLHFFNGVGNQALSWIFAFNIANAVFSVSSLVLHSRHLYFSRQFIKEIHAKIDNEDWIKALELIISKDDLFLQHRFLVSKEDQVVQKVKLLYLRITRNPEKKAENLAEAKNLVELLVGRVVQNQFSRSLAIVSALITCIGLTILLFSPFSVAAYCLLAVAPAILVGRFFMDHSRRKKFLSRLEEMVVKKEKGIEMQPETIKKPIPETPPTSSSSVSLPQKVTGTPAALPDFF